MEAKYDLPKNPFLPNELVKCVQMPQIVSFRSFLHCVFVMGALHISGCSSFLLYPFYGIQKPHKDTKEFCDEILLKHQFDTANSYFISQQFVDSISIEKYALNQYKLKTNTSASPLQLRMYEQSGALVYGWAQCFGDLGHSHILDSIPFKHRPSLDGIINFDLQLATDLELLDLSKSERQQMIKRLEQNEFVIVVFYAGWTGWFTKDAFKKLRRYVDSHPDRTIGLVFINTSK